jgi:hypothetical protein
MRVINREIIIAESDSDGGLAEGEGEDEGRIGLRGSAAQENDCSNQARKSLIRKQLDFGSWPWASQPKDTSMIQVGQCTIPTIYKAHDNTNRLMPSVAVVRSTLAPLQVQ